MRSTICKYHNGTRSIAITMSSKEITFGTSIKIGLKENENAKEIAPGKHPDSF